MGNYVADERYYIVKSETSYYIIALTEAEFQGVKIFISEIASDYSVYEIGYNTIAEAEKFVETLRK